MDVVERLTLEAAQADTMLAAEHRQRYDFAAALCRAASVVDLCCGSGYGSEILAQGSDRVLGVDNDAATIDTARVTVGRQYANVEFAIADAVEFLAGERSREFEVLVCFEGLEHLSALELALARLREHADAGRRLVVSVPNDKLFEAENPFHVTAFGYDEAMSAFEGFPGLMMVPQFLAEGSCILPAGAADVEVALTLEDRYEPEYANHFIFCVNFDPSVVERVHAGKLQLNTSPVFNRWSEDLKRGAWQLRRENARLARARLGKAGSAAASALARLEQHAAQVGALQERCRVAESRVLELEGELKAALRARAQRSMPSTEAEVSSVGVTVHDTTPYALSPGEDSNSWDNRRRRAADVLIPWIEQTVSLAGKTVLEYGCGNGAVSCAFAARAGRLIGLDIDADAVAMGRTEAQARGLGNVELECHPEDGIRAAVESRRGQIDVFLLYAVLEHLTVSERLAVLRLAREVLAPGGVVVVCETPNRLTYLDHHTAQLPFFHLLPDELALEYHQRSEREDFKDALAAQDGAEAKLRTLARWGRGVSFHEFELVFGELSRHVLASSYEPALFSERPVHAEEVMLARYLDRVRPDLPPAFSRVWLDLILSPTQLDRRPAFVRPWTADTTGSVNVGWTAWDNLHLSAAGAFFPVTLPHTTSRVLIGSVTLDGHWARVEVAAEGQPALGAPHRVPAGHTSFASFAFEAPVQRLTVSASAECHVVFVGYED